MALGDGTIARELLDAAIHQGVKEAVQSPDTPLEAKDAPVVTQIVTDSVKSDPQLANALNAESPLQSRVGWGGTATLLIAIGVIMRMTFPLDQTWQHILTGTFEWDIFGSQLAIIGGAAFALYGRFKTGLKPLFWRKKT